MQTLTLFVSSPGDVRDERQVVGRVVERIQARYWNFIRLEPVLWEKEPLRATAHFNEELIRPSDCDLFLCVLWSRLGSPLPSQFNRADGTRFDSGTEWELVEATDAFEKRQAEGDLKPRPDILVYRRMSEPIGADQEQVRKLKNFSDAFFFNEDGTIRRAFSPYSSVAEFAELLEMHLEKMVLRHIQMQRGLVEEAVRPLPVEGSPFMGLGTFDFGDASLFFGRNRAIAETLQQWKENHAAGHAFLLIYGGSGYGKSSLMRAGLVPRIIAPGYIPEVGAWRRMQLIPGEGGCGCIDGLARALLTAVPEIAATENPLDLLGFARAIGSPETLAMAVNTLVRGLDAAAEAGPVHVVLAIDQLEEIFTSSQVEPADREMFFNVIAAIAMCGRFWVVATMRSEFFPRIPENRNLHPLVRHNGGYILSPPELSELHQIIRYPALAAGLEFERDVDSGRDLSEVIYQEAAAAPDALPLLEFTLEELYQRREQNLLTWKAYQELGGLSGAIAKRAQEVFESLNADLRQDSARWIFGELVTLDGDQKGPATRRRASRELLEKAHPGAPQFLRAFVAAQLLVTSSEDGVPTITLAHEALTTHWPVLRDWISDHRELLQARTRLESATRLWANAGRSPKLLLAEGRLAEAQRVSESGVFQLSDAETDLLRFSIGRAKRKLRWFQTATAVFAILALAAGVLGVVAKQRQIKADRAEQLTRLSLAEADFDAGAARAEDQKPDEALPFLLESLKNNPRNLEAQTLLLSTLRQTSWLLPVGEIYHPQPVTQLGFGNDSNILFTGTDFGNRGDGFNSVLRWDLAGGKMQANLAPGGNELQTLRLSPDALHAIVQRGYKRPDATLLCDTKSMRVLRSLPVSNDTPVPCFAWSPDGKLLAYPKIGESPRFQKTWQILEIASGEVIRESRPWANEIDSPLAASFDGKRLRAIHAAGEVLDLNTSTDPAENWSSLDTEGTLNSALFSPDGLELLVAPAQRENQNEGTAILYQVVEEAGKIRYVSKDANPEDSWLQPQRIRQNQPWTYWYSPVWQKLLAAPKAGDPIRMFGGQQPLIAPLLVDGPRLEMVDGSEGGVLPVAPWVADAAIKSIAFQDQRMAVGTASGKVFLADIAPRIGYPMNPGKKRSAEESEDWLAQKKFPNGSSWERKYGELAIRSTGGEFIPLQQHPNWQMISDCSLRRDGDIAVLAGYGSSTGGYVSPGLLMVDARSGRVISELEPLEAASAVEFLADGKRLAAIGSDEVALMEWSGNDFIRLGTIPVAGATALHPFTLPGADDCLALASVDQVKIYQVKDLSLISTMPLPQSMLHEIETEGGLEPRATAWAVDSARGWLAMRSHHHLHVWQIKSGRALLSNVRLPDGADTIQFDERDGILGIRVTGSSSEFVPLARTRGVSDPEQKALSDLTKYLAGVGFGGDSKAIIRLERPTRLELQTELGKQREIMTVLFPGTAFPLPDITRTNITISPLAWGDFWQRLLLAEFPDYDNIARDTEPFREEPWRRAMIQGLIARQDARLYAPSTSEGEDNNPYLNVYQDLYHRLAGDSSELQTVKNAAWKLKFTTPETAGAALLAEEWDEEWKDLDPKAVGALNPEALSRFGKWIQEYPQNDERKTILAWVGEREQAMAAVMTYQSGLRETYQNSPTPEAGYRLAEALMLADQRDEAEALVVTLEKDAATPYLAAAHFLLASGLSKSTTNSVNRALKQHQSPWLWRDWLSSELSRGVTLEELAPQILEADPKANVASVELLKLAMAQGDVATLKLVSAVAENLPPSIQAFIQAMVDWKSGNKKAVFAKWPDDFPDAFDLSEQEDWQGWEQAMEFEVTQAFFKEPEEEAAVLKCPDNASAEDALNVATVLLDPASEELFGKSRIANAIPSCGDQLALWQGTAEMLDRLLARAKEVGLRPFAMIRLQAQLRSAEENIPEASALWNQVIKHEEATSKDFLAGAFAALKNNQSLEAFRIASNGLDRFEHEASYANDAGWLLLQFSLPAEALDLLDRKKERPTADDAIQMRYILTICAADQSTQTKRADETFKEYATLYPTIVEEEVIRGFNLPELLTGTLISVARRNP